MRRAGSRGGGGRRYWRWRGWWWKVMGDGGRVRQAGGRGTGHTHKLSGGAQTTPGAELVQQAGRAGQVGHAGRHTFGSGCARPHQAGRTPRADMVTFSGQAFSGRRTCSLASRRSYNNSMDGPGECVHDDDWQRGTQPRWMATSSDDRHIRGVHKRRPEHALALSGFARAATSASTVSSTGGMRLCETEWRCTWRWRHLGWHPLTC